MHHALESTNSDGLDFLLTLRTALSVTPGEVYYILFYVDGTPFPVDFIRR